MTLARDDAPRADGVQQREVVFDRVFAVILLERAIDQEPVPAASIIILVTDAHPRIDQVSHSAIMHAALGMTVDGDIILLLPQLPQEPQGFNLARADKVLLVNRIQVRVSLQQVLRPGPEDEGVDIGCGKVGAQLVNERRGKECVANAGQRDNPEVHVATCATGA